MKSHCLPFNQIPHTARLFTDFLSYTPKVQQFYPHSPRFNEWFREEASSIDYDPERRAKVSAVLERQNKAWNVSAKALQNIERLRRGAAAVVSGQQVGLFGGTSFSLFKALTAAKLAEQATSAGVDCVPVFWLATDDHDLAEINHVTIPAPNGSPHRLNAPTQGLPDAPVGTIKLGSEIESVVAEAAELLGDSDISILLRDAYKSGETFGSAYARLFATLFAEWGVILLDASDPEIHELAGPILRSAIEKSAQLGEGLLARGKEIESAGYHQQVKVTPSSTLLFAIQNGSRTPVHRRTNATTGDEEFLIGEEKISKADLLKRIDSSPGDFSANVLLRPVVQDYLLPTITYAGGAAEIAYFAQAGAVYEALLDRVTPIVMRFSATLVESKPQSLLEKYALDLIDVFRGPEALRAELAARTLSAKVQDSFEKAASLLNKSLSGIRESLEQLDKTLIDAANNAESKMQYQLDQLRSRAARAELRHSEVIGRHAEILSNLLYPNKGLQEREIAGIYFVAHHGNELLRNLYQMVNADCLDHQVVFL
ncbi:MAG TPA: bacillithiol biosynthesis cysteine-adding enzyme BshC [Terriglobales bacterium]|nr:bacillithiol biosynthesis cysteine-adding enzyme BshC [Terriglobales bacterium]